jgi:hypothetical protein
MAAKKKQQTHAKRARELAVKEKRERKAAKKAARAAGLLDLPTDEYGNVLDPEAEGDDEATADEATADEATAEPATAEPAAAEEWIR